MMNYGLKKHIETITENVTEVTEMTHIDQCLLGWVWQNIIIKEDGRELVKGWRRSANNYINTLNK